MFYVETCLKTAPKLCKNNYLKLREDTHIMSTMRGLGEWGGIRQKIRCYRYRT